jgi:hypothetical protein
MRLALRDVPEVARPRSAFKVKRGAFLEQEVNGGGGMTEKGPGLIKVNQSDQSKTARFLGSRK